MAESEAETGAWPQAQAYRWPLGRIRLGIKLGVQIKLRFRVRRQRIGVTSSVWVIGLHAIGMQGWVTSRQILGGIDPRHEGEGVSQHVCKLGPLVVELGSVCGVRVRIRVRRSIRVWQ